MYIFLDNNHPYDYIISMELNTLRKKDKKRAYIRSLLVLYGITGQEIANSVGVTRAYVSMVISGKEKSARVSSAIAKALIDRIAENKGEQKTARIRKRIALALGIKEENNKTRRNNNDKAA